MMQKKPRIRTDSRIFQIAGVVLFWLGCAEVWSESEFTKQVRELAEQGSAEAQNNLGFMYQQGEWGCLKTTRKQ